MDARTASGCRIEGAQLARELHGALTEVERGFCARDLGRVGDARGRLCNGFLQMAGLQGRDDGARAGRHQLVMQGGCGVGCFDGHPFAQQHRAGIEPFLHAHDAYAGARIAGFNRALHRCRTAPARQE